MRLIRSKGVGVFFVTQQPTDLSEEVLAQLGLRIQHALRAFTPSDAKKLRATVSTYPRSELYDVETLLTSVGTGEAAVTLLSEKGVPTPVVHTRLVGPSSSMEPAPDLDAAAKASPLWAKYGERVDAESAHELLAQRMAGPRAEPVPAAGAPAEPDLREPMEHVPPPASARSRAARRRPAGVGCRRDRRLPALAGGEGAAAQGHARHLRDAAQADLVSEPPGSTGSGWQRRRRLRLGRERHPGARRRGRGGRWPSRPDPTA